ncbi:hypothetical protein OH492_07515 [Vibrio chagasii]|nr:hypothetical protein [Vibrio chagasii]
MGTPQTSDGWSTKKKLTALTTPASVRVKMASRYIHLALEHWKPVVFQLLMPITQMQKPKPSTQEKRVSTASPS